MSSASEIGGNPIVDTQPYCHASDMTKKVIYGAAVTLVALAVIFGALVLITQDYGLNWGPLNDSIQQCIQHLGQYSFVPLAASCGLLLTLGCGGIIWKKCADTQIEEVQTKIPAQENATIPEDLIAAVARGDTAFIQNAVKSLSLPIKELLFLEAASKGQAEIVNLLFMEDVHPTGKDSRANSALHLAILCEDCQKSLATMEALLILDAELVSEKAGEGGQTPLHLAVHGEGAKEKVALLIKNDAEVDASDKMGSTPLLTTVASTTREPNIDLIELLVDHGADVCAKAGNKTFEQLAQENHSEWLNNPDINARLVDKKLIQSPQISAVIRGDIGTIQNALAAGKLSNTTELLHLAVEHGHTELVRLLLENGADPKAHNSAGYSALHQAINLQKNGLAIMRVLLEKDRSLVSEMTHTRTKSFPLHLAVIAEVDAKEKVELLLSNEAEVNILDTSGKTPLLMIASNHPGEPKIEVVEHLLAAGATNQDEDFETQAKQCHASWFWNQDIQARLKAKGIGSVATSSIGQK